MKLKTAIKISDNNLSFLRRASNNKAFDTDKKPMTPSQVLDLIERYFKLNNNIYKDMIQMGEEK